MQLLRHLQSSLTRVLLSLVLALAALAPLSHPRAARAAGPYEVNVVTDALDFTPNNGVCDDGTGHCTLRAAISEAAFEGGTTITFAPALTGTTLFLSDTFGALLWTGSNITVTGEAKNITISGDNFTSGQNLFEISGNGNTLAHLTLRDAPGDAVQVGDLNEVATGNDNRLDSLIVLGSGVNGIYVYGANFGGGQRNHLTNNWIGTSDPSASPCLSSEGNGTGVFISHPAVGTLVSGNVIGCSQNSGVYLTGGFGSPLGTSLTNNLIGIGSADADLGNGQAGVRIFSGAGDVTIDQNTISANDGQGIDIGSATAQTFTITDNLIGTNLAGSEEMHNGMQGILIENVDNALAQITDNVISGNNLTGVQIDNSGGVTLALNRIGVNSLGNGPLPNGVHGVALLFGAHDNFIGYAGGGNIISGNGMAGVLLTGADTTLNTLAGNYIGTNIDGDAALPNGDQGVRLQNGAHDNTIGSPTDFGARNVISGNGEDGVRLQSGANANQLDGNYIGVNADGAAALPNGGAGVSVLSSDDNILGSLGAAIAQLISANVHEGIYINGSNGTIIGDFNGIGVSLSPLVAPAGNGGAGILLFDASGTRILAAYIAYNNGAGVAVEGASAANKIAPVFNALNAGLPIDLNGDGPTPNDLGDADTGPNGLLNYPVVTAVTATTAYGTACANCRVFVYQAIGNPAASRGGGQKLGEVLANGSGDWSIGGLPAGLTRLELSAVTCQNSCMLSGNTSEMSPRPVLFLPVLFRP